MYECFPALQLPNALLVKSNKQHRFLSSDVGQQVLLRTVVFQWPVISIYGLQKLAQRVISKVLPTNILEGLPGIEQLGWFSQDADCAGTVTLSGNTSLESPALMMTDPLMGTKPLFSGHEPGILISLIRESSCTVTFIMLQLDDFFPRWGKSCDMENIRI